MFKIIAKTVTNHPWYTITFWSVLSALIVSVALGGVLGSTIFDRMKTDNPTVVSESQTGTDIIKSNNEQDGYTETVFILTHSDDVEETSKSLDAFFNDVKQYSDDKNVDLVTPYGTTEEIRQAAPQLENLIVEDSFVSTLTLQNEDKETLEHNVYNVEKYVNEAASDNGLTNIEVGSETLLIDAVMHQAESDLAKGESIAFPVALLVMVLVFGGLLAAGMPLIGAGVSIVSALGTLYGLSFLMPVDTSTLNVLTVIGLGLSIDYGLLMVSRFRETLRKYDDPHDKENIKQAARDTLSTAGRTVFFSGLTVAVSTLTLLLFQPELLKTIGFAATSVVLLAVLTSTTLLPALFVLLGDKLIKPSFLQKIPGIGWLMRKLGDVAPRNGFFSHTTGRVQKHPWVYGFLSTGLLVVLSVPMFSMNIDNNGVDKTPVGTVQGDIFTTLKNDYTIFNEPDILIVVDDAKKQGFGSKMGELLAVLDNTSGIEHETVDFKIMDTAAQISVNVIDGENIKQVVQELRGEFKPYEKVYITGETALNMDYVDSLAQTAPWVALIVILATGILLFLMTGSALIPLKAVFLSVLSLGASLGVLTWGFQEGNLSELLNFDPDRIVGIDPLILILTLIFGFGLAMDYEMFLVSRIKEKHASGASTNLSVRSGLQASGRIITSAALMIVIVFLGFALGDMLFVKMMGVALAFAVIIDATVVRMILLPAIFTVLGDRIWWAPKWMQKIHDKIGVEH